MRSKNKYFGRSEDTVLRYIREVHRPKRFPEYPRSKQLPFTATRISHADEGSEKSYFIDKSLNVPQSL